MSRNNICQFQRFVFFFFPDRGIWESVCPPPRWLSGKESACQCRRSSFDPWVGKISYSRKWHSTPVLLPGKFCGQRSLVGCSPQGYKELDMTERLTFTFFFSQCISKNVWIFQFSFHYWNLNLSCCKSEKILCIKSVFLKSNETICGLTNGLSWVCPCTLRKNIYFLVLGLGRVLDRVFLKRYI